jgi:hypothetical protein
MTAEYILEEDIFHAPHLVKKGSRITYDGPLGPHFTPVNEEAEAAMAQYWKEHPDASLRPVDGLSDTMEPQPTLQVVAEPDEASSAGVAITELAQTKAKPGLSDGGKALDIKKK